MMRRYRLALVAGVIVALLIALRLVLPALVRDYVNDQLATLEAYDGSIADVDLSFIKGAYAVENIRIVKTAAERSTPFFSADRMEASIEWPNLLRGALVGRAQFMRPNLNLVQAKTPEESQLGQEENWAERLERLVPFRLNTLRVHDGTVTFRAPGIRAEDALVASHVNGELSNLTNVVETGKETFARFHATGAVLEGGEARIDGAFDPLGKAPTFDVNLSLRNVQLPQVNPWLNRFIKADAESGQFELYVELAAADGKFKGYAKPVMQNVNIYSSEEPERNPLRRLWEGLIEFAAEVFENEEQEQVAARVPFSGTIENPKAGVFATMVSVLRNAFVGAFARSLEGSISVREVRKTLEDVGKPEDENGQAKERRSSGGGRRGDASEPKGRFQ
jgi:hypothetical protein